MSRIPKAVSIRLILVTAAAVAVMFTISLSVVTERFSERDPLIILAPHVTGGRPIEARVVRLPYGPRADIPRARTGVPAYELLAAAAKLEVAAAGRADTAARHAGAVAKLVMGRTDEAIADFERAAREDPTPEHFSDLSAAYITRGTRSSSDGDFVAAYEAAENALSRDKAFTPAVFNRALALESHGLFPREAIEAWDRYLELDPSSNWGGEASRRRQALRTAPKPRSSSERSRALEEALQREDYGAVESLSLDAPQEARTHAEEILLPSWAREVVEREAKGVGTGMKTIARVLRDRGDPWLTDVCELLDGADDKTRVVLAAGLLSLERANIEYRGGRPSDAIRQAREAARALAGTPLEPLALLVEAGARYVRRDFGDRGREASAQALERYPSLRARMQWVEGLVACVTQSPYEARVALQSAATTLATLGERENAAASRTFAAQALELLGDEDASWTERLRAAKEIIDSGGSVRRWHTTLFVLAEAAHRRGAHNYAVLLADSILTRATEHRNPERAVDALNVRAVAAAATGRHDTAIRDLNAAFTWAKSIRDKAVRERTLLFIDRAAVETFSSSDPARALAHGEQALNKAAEIGDYARMSEIRFKLATILRKTGRTREAEREFQFVLGEMEKSRESVQSEDLRMSFAETAAGAVDALMEMLIEQNRGDEAFALVKRVRNLELRRSRERESNDVPMATNADRAVTVVYAVLEQQIIVWCSWSGVRSMHTIAVGRRQLSELIDSLRLNINDRKSSEALYRALIAPVAQHLTSGHALSIIPDKELHALPFAALRDPDSGRYLVELIAIEIAAFSDAAVRRAGPREASSAVVVGNPTIATTLGAALPPLAAAEREAATVAARYPSAVLLTRARATKERFLAFAPRHPVVHFAGHGRSNLREGGASALFFAPGADDGVLYARDLRGMKFNGVDLLVLAGCQTAEGKAYSLEGMTGMARAALTAGVGEVIATLGQIDDEAALELFARFHQKVVRGERPCDALRASQIEMIHSNHPVLAKPSAWGLVELLVARKPPS